LSRQATLKGRLYKYGGGDEMLTSFRVLIARVRGVLGVSDRDAELRDEIQAHLSHLESEYLAKGLSPDNARLAARKAFGGVDRTRAEHRDQRGLPFLENVLQDVRFAVRLMWRDRATASLAIATLALTIGMLTFVLSVVNGVLWRPLPVERPDAVFFVQADTVAMSFPDYQDLCERTRDVAELIGYRISPMSVEHRGQSSLLWGYLATGNYFTALGVRPAVGRFFGPGDDTRPGDAPFAVLSYDTWQSRFAGDPHIAGSVVRINAQPFTILGVAPRGFHGTEVFYRPALWVPMMMQAAIEPGNPWLDRRWTQNTMVSAVIAPTATRAVADARLAAEAARLDREHVGRNEPLAVRLARPGLLGDLLGGPARVFLWALAGLGVLLLAAGCSNLAGLLLARGMDRAREIAVRTALGASRARITRQLMVEATLLSALGGAAGVALAVLGTRALAARRLPVELPVQLDVGTDLSVLAAIAASIVALGIVIGLAPVRFAGRLDVVSTIRDGGAMAVGGRRWHIRDGLVALQVMFAVVLLYTCLLSLRGWQRASEVPLGWKPDGLMLAAMDLGLAGYDDVRGGVYHERLLAEARRLPGVSAVAIGNSVPLHIDQSRTTVFGAAGRENQDGESAAIYQVSRGYFAALDMPLLAGRDFTLLDDRGRPAVTIVNRTLAERLFGGVDAAVGQSIRSGRGGTPAEIVGVVGNAKYAALAERPSGAVFRPLAQSYNSSTVLLARFDRPRGTTIAELRAIVAGLDPAVPIRFVGPASDLLAFPLFPYRAAAAVLVLLGLVTVGLMLTGLHGLLAYSVTARQRDIGVRLALGAGSLLIMRSVMARVLVVVGTGIVVGLGLALSAGSALSSLALGVGPYDPLLLAGLAASIGLIALASGWGPVRRMLKIDPLTSLRQL
jgi:predicted permease